VAVSLLKSRKVWLALAAVLIPILNRALGLGLNPVEVGSALAVIATVIVGIAWEDAAWQANHHLARRGPAGPRPRRPGRATRADKGRRSTAGVRPRGAFPRPDGKKPSQARRGRRRRWVPISSNC
jgi:hypothetical protein